MEMCIRDRVCAQCHVEYYMQPETKKLTFPWAKGLKPDEILEYYDNLNFSDWLPVSYTHLDVYKRQVQLPVYDYTSNLCFKLLFLT